MKEIEEMRDFEFSEYMSNYSFINNQNLDEDGDEIKEDILKENKKRENSLTKYVIFATGFVYTITAPVILLISIYYVYLKFSKNPLNKIFLIFLILLGIFTGYWNLYKELKKITKNTGDKNGSKNKKIK